MSHHDNFIILNFKGLNYSLLFLNDKKGDGGRVVQIAHYYHKTLI